jgi:hypothetical protein
MLGISSVQMYINQRPVCAKNTCKQLNVMGHPQAQNNDVAASHFLRQAKKLCNNVICVDICMLLVCIIHITPIGPSKDGGDVFTVYIHVRSAALAHTDIR